MGGLSKMMDDDDGLKGKWNTITCFSKINFIKKENGYLDHKNS